LSARSVGHVPVTQPPFRKSDAGEFIANINGDTVIS